MTKPQKPHLPSKQEILDFIKESPGRVGKREIGRAFRIKGADRIPLKHLLNEMKEKGLIGGGRGDHQREKQRITAESGLPPRSRHRNYRTRFQRRAYGTSYRLA